LAGLPNFPCPETQALARFAILADVLPREGAFEVGARFVAALFPERIEGAIIGRAQGMILGAENGTESGKRTMQFPGVFLPKVEEPVPKAATAVIGKHD